MNRIHIFYIAVLGSFSVSCNAEILRFQEIAPGIFRGSQPESPEDYAFLQRHRIKSILNLRGGTFANHPFESFLGVVEKERKIAQSLNMNFYHIAPGGTYLSEVNPENVSLILQTISNPSVQPIFIHCKHGRDRTGFIAALYRAFLQGRTKSFALREWMGFGFNPSKYPKLFHHFETLEALDLQ